MPVAAPAEGYLKMIAYGQHKAHLRWDQLTLQSCLAGFWVAVYGHACTYFAAQFYTPDGHRFSGGLTKLTYGALFPGAFVAVFYTGTELFTGNTVTMLMLVLNDGRQALKHLIRVWSISLFGNLAGAVFGAFLLTWSSHLFHEGTQESLFLFALTSGKVSHAFTTNLVLGIGCNAMVCCATWCCVVSDDGAGKVLAIFYTIAVFAMGGYEHIVANFYTLTAAHFCGYSENSFGTSVWRNWIPVFLGNLLAGTLFTGMMWWYALHPQYSDLAPYTDAELTRELSRRANAPGIALGDEIPSFRWTRNPRAMDSKSSFFLAPHRVPGVPGSGPLPPATDYSSYVINPQESNPYRQSPRNRTETNQPSSSLNRTSSQDKRKPESPPQLNV